MKMPLFLIVPIALGLSACQPSEGMKAQWSALQESREAELAQAGAQWQRAYNAGDWDALRALYADDAVLMPHGAPKSAGADTIITFLQRISRAGGSAVLQFENEEVLTGSGAGAADLGFVTAKYRMDIAIPGKEPRVIAGRSLLVYKWQDGGWKIWRDMDNFSPEVTTDMFEKAAPQ